MKINLPFYAITTFCLLYNQVVYSESLIEIYDLAKTNDLQYQSDIARFNANKEIKAISRSGLLPQISGGVSYGWDETDTTTTPASPTSTFFDGTADTIPWKGARPGSRLPWCRFVHGRRHNRHPVAHARCG